MNQKGQDALDYLLLIGGAILVVAILIVLVIGSSNPIERENLGKITDFEISKGFNGIACKVTIDNTQSYMVEYCDGVDTTKCLYLYSSNNRLIARECEQVE